MMQKFYLKNLASASVVAILFSAISLGTIAEQESAPMDKDSKHILTPSEKTTEAPLPMSEEMKPSMDKSGLDEGLSNKVYQEMLEGETHDVETPNTPVENRALNRLQELNESDLLELPKEDEVTLGMTEEENMTETVASQVSLPSATPTISPTTIGSAEPKGSVTPIAWDDEETREPQPEEDPEDPTSEGQGPGGKHKMGRMRQTGRVIPIIRMGQNTEENRGFTIIKPWNS